MTGEGGWAGGVGCYPAAELALEHVNTKSDLLPGYNLVMAWNDSEVRQQHSFFTSLYGDNFLTPPPAKS